MRPKTMGGGAVPHGGRGWAVSHVLAGVKDKCVATLCSLLSVVWVGVWVPHHPHILVHGSTRVLACSTPPLSFRAMQLRRKWRTVCHGSAHCRRWCIDAVDSVPLNVCLATATATTNEILTRHPCSCHSKQKCIYLTKKYKDLINKYAENNIIYHKVV